MRSRFASASAPSAVPSSLGDGVFRLIAKAMLFTALLYSGAILSLLIYIECLR
jgi:hypothetical protein